MFIFKQENIETKWLNHAESRRDNVAHCKSLYGKSVAVVAEVNSNYI